MHLPKQTKSLKPYSNIPTQQSKSSSQQDLETKQLLKKLALKGSWISQAEENYQYRLNTMRLTQEDGAETTK